MNSTELKMVEILKELVEVFYATGVKAEFEAEGTRTEELMRLKEICLAAHATLALKIGGCEALRDMYDARAVGVNYLVAPMVETAFSLKKYLQAIDIAFPSDEQKAVEFLINIETDMAVRNFDEMMSMAQSNKLNGVVFGRVDYVGSLGLDRACVNSEDVFNTAKDLLSKAKKLNLTCVLGGAISLDSIPFLKRLPSKCLDRYETRKICFDCPQALLKNPQTAILKAIEFELLWLKNKHNYYKWISQEDSKRIQMLEARLNKG